MTLTIHTEEDEQRQLKVTVNVPEERVQSQMRETARALAREVRIPGFRKGKVPYNILVRRVGEKALRADAIEEMLESVLAEALDQVDVVAYRQPSLDDMEMEPLTIKLTIPLEPKIELGDYRAIRKEVKPVEVADEALDDALEHIRSHYQELEEVDRPAAIGDMLTVSGEGKIEGEEDQEGEVIWHEHDTDLVLDPERTFPGLPFVDNLVGLSAGDEKHFEVVFPEDYEEEELAGKKATFEVTVGKVQRRELPELDDELAQKEGDYETVEELRQGLQEQLYEQARREARSDLLEEFVEEILESAELVYPPAAIETELDSMVENLRDQVTRSGWKWEDYLTLQGQTEESLREEWREQATTRVRRGLVLAEFITQEKLRVRSADVDEAVEERVSPYSENEELQNQLRSLFSQGAGLQAVSNEILMEKAYDRVEAIVTGNAPDLDELEIEEASSEEEE